MRRSIVALAMALAMLVAGCGGSDDETTTDDRANDDSAADDSAAGTAGLDEGAELYAANCASCHGAELEGTDEGPPHLSVIY